jgi:hypothetical protein
MSAAVETFLKGFADPRLPVYAVAATDKAVEDKSKVSVPVPNVRTKPGTSFILFPMYLPLLP